MHLIYAEVVLKSNNIILCESGRIASILQVLNIKYFAFQDRYYTEIIQSSSVVTLKTHFRKCALHKSGTPNEVS